MPSRRRRARNRGCPRRRRLSPPRRYPRAAGSGSARRGRGVPPRTAASTTGHRTTAACSGRSGSDSSAARWRAHAAIRSSSSASSTSSLARRADEAAHHGAGAELLVGPLAAEPRAAVMGARPRGTTKPVPVREPALGAVRRRRGGPRRSTRTGCPRARLPPRAAERLAQAGAATCADAATMTASAASSSRSIRRSAGAVSVRTPRARAASASGSVSAATPAAGPERTSDLGRPAWTDARGLRTRGSGSPARPPTPPAPGRSSARTAGPRRRRRAPPTAAPPLGRWPRRPAAGAAARPGSPPRRPCASCAAGPARRGGGLRATAPASAARRRCRPGMPNGASCGSRTSPPSVHSHAPAAPVLPAATQPARGTAPPPRACGPRTSRRRPRAPDRRPAPSGACRPARSAASSTVTSADGSALRAGGRRRQAGDPAAHDRDPARPARVTAHAVAAPAPPGGRARPRPARPGTRDRRWASACARTRCPPPPRSGRASMSRSNRISRWSATNPAEHTTTAGNPPRASCGITSSIGGPHHGSAVRPALCHAIVWCGEAERGAPPRRRCPAARRGSGRRPRSRRSCTASMPSWSVRVGSECAEKITAASPRARPARGARAPPRTRR